PTTGNRQLTTSEKAVFMRIQLTLGVLLLIGSSGTAHRPLPTGHCPLATAHWPLATAHCLLPTDQKPDAKAPNYYPLQVDNAWHYKITVGGNPVDAVARVVKIDDINGEKLPRLELTRNGNVLATEHLRQTNDGVFRHRNKGADITPPICLLKYPIKGDA